MHPSRGFTLIELIVTLILVGILSVTVIPRFFGAQSEQAYTYRDRTLAMMRAMQLQAMHRVGDSNCVNITATLVAPAKHHDCSQGIASDGDDFLLIDSSASPFTFSTTDNQGGSFNLLAFDPLGRPDVACAERCEVRIGGQGICISTEGLIYACQ